MAHIVKVIDANDTRQGDALVATSPKDYKTVATVIPDVFSLAASSGSMDDFYQYPRMYTGDTDN